MTSRITKITTCVAALALTAGIGAPAGFAAPTGHAVQSLPDGPARTAPPDSTSSAVRLVAVTPDEALLSSFPSQWPARIEVETPSGGRERTVTDVPGDPARPFDANAVREKFRRLSTPVTGAAAAEQTLERAFGLLRGKIDPAGLLHQIDGIGLVRQREELK